MLESLVSALLNRFLGAYVENFDPTQLNVGIWNGDVKLRNLRLRKDSLDALDLPVDVKFGHLGELTLLIPWSSLKNKPVKIIIEDVYMLCTSRTPESYNVEEQVERELKLKLQRIADLELANSSKPDVDLDSSRNESFTQSLLTKIVDNLQVTVKNIHMRYEDMDSVFSEKPCAFGISLSELSSVSTDESWNPSFISIKQQITHKLTTLDSISLYCNTDTESIDTEDSEELLIRLRETIADKHGAPAYQYLLKPVRGSARLKLNKAGSTEDAPHIDMQLLFDEFALVLDDCQYKEVLHNMSKYHWFHKTLKYRRYRPTVTPSADPVLWFKYAANCVLSEIHEKNYKSSWEYIKDRRINRDEYVSLFKKKLTFTDINDPLPNVDENKRLNELDKELSFDDIKFFRAFARRQFSQESKFTQISETITANSNPQGWFSSWWAPSNTKSDNNLTMTDEQRQELYDAIEYDASNDPLKSIDLPKDRTTLRITNLLQKGSLTIMDKTKGHQMCDFIFEKSATEFLNRSDSFLFKFELSSFLVEDGSPHTLYRHIVSPRGTDERENNPLLHVCFDSCPVDESADTFLDIKFGSVFIYYHVHFINELLRFFNPPTRHWETISALMNAAEATVEGWTSQTRMGLEALLTEHKTIDLKLNAASPTIILPLDAHSWDSPCAIIDAGSIKMSSDLVPKQEIKKIKELSVDEYAKIDSDELKRLMFDRFRVKLTDTQFLIGPDMKSSITSINVKQRDNNFTILEKMELDFILDVLIFPKAFNLPRVTSSIKLPNLKLFLNDFQYKIMMQLVDRCIPYVEDGTDDQSNDTSSQSFSQLIPLDNVKEPSKALLKHKETLLLKQTKKTMETLKKAELDQISFQLFLDVSKIEISLLKCFEGPTMKSSKLVKLVGEHLSLNLQKKLIQMDFGLSLTELRLEDHISTQPQDTAEKYIIFSNNTANQEKLFNINGSRIQQIIEYETTLYEVFDVSVDLRMSELTLSLMPKSILTLLNFVLNTFTDPETPAIPSSVLRQSDQQDSTPGKTNVKIYLDGVNIILNDEFSKLATFSIHNSELQMDILPQSMKLKGKLGDMKLVDETSVELPKDSVFRELISKEDDDLAEIIYETFDPETNKNSYDSYLYYRTGAVRINFIEHSINKIIGFFAKFQKMKVLFDTAHNSTYSKTPDIESVNNMKLDIMIRTPSISFPKLVDPRTNRYDELIWNMGDFYISNEFTGDVGKLVNNLTAGIKNAHILSIFNFDDQRVQKLSAIDHLDLRFDVSYDQFHTDSDSLIKIKGYFAPFYISLTDLQLQYIYLLSQKIASTFIVNPSDDDMEDAEIAALNANAVIDPEKELYPSQTIFKSENSSPGSKRNIKIEFEFNAPEFCLSLFNETSGKTSLKDLGVAKFTLNDFGLTGSALDSSSASSEMHIKSFTVEDIRYSRTNKHTQLIPKIEGEHYQFMASVDFKQEDLSSTTNLEVTIDSPKVVLAIEFLFALQSFANSSLNVKQAANIRELSLPSEQPNSKVSLEEDTVANANSTGHKSSKVNYSINVVDSAIILLADPGDKQSEAIVFTIGQFLVTDHNILSIAANNVGLFLSKMGDLSQNRIRILDDFSSTVMIDGRNSTPDMLKTQIHSSVGPLLLRLSLRDIRLAMEIFNSSLSLAKTEGLMSDASSISEKEEDISTKYGKFSKEFKEKIKKYAPSMVSSLSEISNALHRNSVTNATKVIAKAEKLHSEFSDIRVVLIGDMHELPIADFNINSFEVDAKDWSTNIDIITTIEPYASAFNYSRSSWEPLVEVFPMTFHLSKDNENGDALMFDIIARKSVEITLSSRTIALLSQIPASLQQTHDLKPRGAEKPYKIFNDTGHTLTIWIKTNDDDITKKRVSRTKLANGEVIDWEFEDWRVVRETLDTEKCILQASFDQNAYSNIIEVDATKEGDFVHKLYPPISGVHNRLLISSKLLENNVKLITFGSTLLLHNVTSSEMEYGLSDKSGFNKIGVIRPDERRSIPVDSAYQSSFHVRPLVDCSVYKWSGIPIFWKTLNQSPLALSCKSEDGNSEFHLEVEGMVENDDPLSKIYPRMTVTLSAPLVLENLLPQDISFSLKGNKNDPRSEMFLQAGATIPLHNVSLDSYLMLSVKPDDENINWSKEILVNSPNVSALEEEQRVFITTVDGQKLYLNLKYHSSGKRAKTVSIYTPYVVLNKTTHDLSIFSDRQWGVLKSNTFVQDGEKLTNPKMFSFQYEDYNRNRAKIKFTETNPSVPVSFDAIGQSVDVSLELLNHNQECNLGINVKEGEGKYRYTKIVEISPRYIFRNSTSDAIEIMEYGTTSPTILTCEESTPLYYLKRTPNKKFVARFAKIPSSWSNPFRLKDVGETFVKMNISDAAQRLIKMEISLEGATLFINAVDSDDNWPFSIRNFSDHEFLFWQRNPRFVDDESDELDSFYQEDEDEVDFDPIYYRIPPRSVMPYSWDYPSAKQKKLFIHTKNRRREIDLNEIGNLRPIRIPSESAKQQPSIVDINILMDNGVQVLVLSNYNQEQSLYKLRSQRRFQSETSVASSVTSNSDKFEVDETLDSKLNARVVISFSGIGISLINHHMQELCYANFLGLELRFNDSEMYQNLSFKVKWIQIDNQLFGGIYETVLYPTKIPKDSKEIDMHPSLSGAVSKVKDDSSSLLNFKLATILLQEMTIQIDEDFLLAVIDFAKVPGASWNQEVDDSLNENLFRQPCTIPAFPTAVKSSKVYFEMLHLQPTLLHLSFVRTDHINVDEEKSSGNSAINYFINVLTMALGNIEGAQIKLNSLLLEHVRVSLPTLIGAIESHYAQQFFYQLHKVLGSADFLGNPVGFFNNISSGVMDIFYEPYQGYIMNDRPQELGIGIAKGGLSFLKKSVFGFSDSFSKMTGSMAKGLSVAIQDASFQERRRLQQRQRGKFGSVGVGASSFFNNVTSGITGVALDPYSGGAKEGAFGFIKGVGKGIIGLPAKTAIGVLDLASNVSEGIRNSTTLMDSGQVERVRLPRYVSSDNLIKPYNLRESQGQYWLKSCNGGEYAKDVYVGHVICETPAGFQIVIVSLQRILRMQLSTLTVMEHIPFRLIRNVRVIKTGITIYTAEREYFFSVPKDEERRYLYKLMHTAVIEFNSKWQITL